MEEFKTVREMLLHEARLYNSYNSPEVRDKAQKAFDNVVSLAYDEVRRTGCTSIKFDSDTLNEEEVPYFKHLCEEQGLGFKDLGTESRSRGYRDFNPEDFLYPERLYVEEMQKTEVLFHNYEISWN